MPHRLSPVLEEAEVCLINICTLVTDRLVWSYYHLLILSHHPTSLLCSSQWFCLYISFCFKACLLHKVSPSRVRRSPNISTVCSLVGQFRLNEFTACFPPGSWWISPTRKLKLKEKQLERRQQEEQMLRNPSGSGFNKLIYSAVFQSVSLWNK